jgi:diguanylate cyclase (GGDEF)-like protein
MPDPLTGLRTQNDGLLVEFRRALGGYACFVDIDGLIWVNDQSGHIQGDRVLIQLADLLREFATQAPAFRIGGDEFLLLFPAQTEATSLEIATTLIARVRALGIRYCRLDRPHRRTLEVNVIAFPLDATCVNALAESGITSATREWFAQQIHEGRILLGRDSGLALERNYRP